MPKRNNPDDKLNIAFYTEVVSNRYHRYWLL